MKFVVSSGVIIKHPKSDAYAMVYQTFWGFPKIKIHDTESIEHGAIRASKLELGINCQLIKNLGSYTRKGPITGDNKEIHFYLATSSEEYLDPKSAVIQKAERINKHEVSQYMKLPEDITFRESIQSKL